MTRVQAKPRRSQAERRAETQDRLLRATVSMLVEQGFVALSAAAVAARAGVSQGAMQHYYPTKVALVKAALERIVERYVADVQAQVGPLPPGAGRFEALLDLLWEVHNLPISRALLELYAVAHNDGDLADVAAMLANLATTAVGDLAGELVPEVAARDGFHEWLLTTLATLRGTALLAVPGAERAHLDWPALRDRLTASLPPPP
ncbi:TetR/AcrR family transcriptional regulator [Nocardia bhagyanarayanae]|uniref:TetR family transcriptional regulator n=1 Tax=Nocardia bhagyanarayanae TaxID=1215925 RepID=A0A543FIQ3_9NOCA|nr:TetR/AcrR family transcriptional regulator [Nocardia bhagyanarayanae]TQM33584.1 TetR family transcriptional regulator [Nocardia bhagyanarayanae]